MLLRKTMLTQCMRGLQRTMVRQVKNIVKKHTHAHKQNLRYTDEKTKPCVHSSDFCESVLKSSFK